MKSSITVIIAIISNTIDKQSGGRGLHRLLDCRETDVVRNRWEINNVSGKTKEQKKKKCNAEIKTLFGNTCCHTAAAHRLLWKDMKKSMMNNRPPWKRSPRSRRLRGCRTALLISSQAGEWKPSSQTCESRCYSSQRNTLTRARSLEWKDSPPCMHWSPRTFWQ